MQNFSKFTKAVIAIPLSMLSIWLAGVVSTFLINWLFPHGLPIHTSQLYDAEGALIGAIEILVPLFLGSMIAYTTVLVVKNKKTAWIIAIVTFLITVGIMGSFTYLF